MEEKKFTIQEIRDLFWIWTENRDIEENTGLVQAFILFLGRTNEVK